MPNDTASDAALPALPSNDLVQMRRELMPSLRIMLDERLYEQVKRLAGVMSRDTAFTPRHLQNKPEACFTVVTQALNWNIDPQFVARCTYQTPGGSIGFEGKLVQAILEQSNRFIGAPKAIYSGDWSRVTGKFTEATSQKGNKYLKPTWTQKDAEGLGIIIVWHVRGEVEPRIWPAEDTPFLLTQCYPLNSTLWATDPRTQIRYLAIRRFATGAAPGILGGMSFEADDLIDASQRMTDITPTPPPRPTREDFTAATVTDVENADEPVWEVVDMVGDITQYTSMDVALAAYNAALDEGEQQKGREGLRTVSDNNGTLFSALEERGFANISKKLSMDIGNRMKVHHDREAAAAAAQTSSTEAAVTGGSGQPATEIPRGIEPAQSGADRPGADLSPGQNLRQDATPSPRNAAEQEGPSQVSASLGGPDAPPPVGDTIAAAPVQSAADRRDAVWWGRNKLTITEHKSNNEFSALMHQYLREARTEIECDRLSDDNGKLIDELPKSAKTDVLTRLAARRRELR